MKEHFFNFMKQMINNHQAEPAPQLQPGEECWYLPIFCIYHPQKPDKIRVVIDSSSRCNGVSLTDVLLGRPDLNNMLIGVLLCFCRELVVIMADIKQVFYCFKVKEHHCNYLRFLWHKNNHPDEGIINYRIVHVFGNSPSPVVTIYGLRKAAEHGEAEHGKDAKEFVLCNFFVDNGISSVSSEEKAIDLLNILSNC